MTTVSASLFKNWEDLDNEFLRRKEPHLCHRLITKVATLATVTITVGAAQGLPAPVKYPGLILSYAKHH